MKHFIPIIALFIIMLSSCSKNEISNFLIYSDSEIFYYEDKQYHFEENTCFLFDAQKEVGVSLQLQENNFIITMLSDNKTISIPFEKGMPNLGKGFCYFCNSKILVRNDEYDFASFYIIDLQNQTSFMIDIEDIAFYEICNFSPAGILLYSLTSSDIILVNINTQKYVCLKNHNEKIYVIRGQDYLVESRGKYLYLINIITSEEINTHVKMKDPYGKFLSDNFFYYDGDNFYYAKKDYIFILKNLFPYIFTSLLPSPKTYPVQWYKRNLSSKQEYKIKLKTNFAVLEGVYSYN